MSELIRLLSVHDTLTHALSEYVMPESAHDTLTLIRFFGVGAKKLLRGQNIMAQNYYTSHPEVGLGMIPLSLEVD